MAFTAGGRPGGSRNGGSRDGASQADMNVTPLVDVVLVLLIIFMVLTPLMQANVDAGLPSQGCGPPADPLVMVTVGRDGIRLGTKPVSEPELHAWLSRWASVRKPGDRQILVAGDDRVSLGSVVRAMDVAAGAGVETVSIVDPID